MTHFRISSVNWLVLYLVFSEDPSGCYSNTVWQLPPPSISLLQAIRDNQSLCVSLQLNHSSLEGNVYEIQIGRTENHTVIYNGNISILSTDSHNYTWTWTSDLPLECVDHSVRIRLLDNQSVLSPWSNWKTNYGDQAKGRTKIFPFQRVLREGTRAVICCVPPKGVNITSISINNREQPLISIGAIVKAVTIESLAIQTTFINALSVNCSDDSGNSRFIWNYVSSPPKKPRNISCMTSDMTTVTCTWESDHEREVDDHNKKTHTLKIQNSDHFQILCKQTSCTFPAVPHLEEYSIIVVVKDRLGEEMESYSFNISERVFPVVECDRVRPKVTDTAVSWLVKGNLSHMNFLCHVTTDFHSTTEMRCQSVSGFCTVKVEHLLPNTRYSTRIRCSADGKLWGEWTQPVAFITFPLVTLDVWRSIKQLPDSNSRQVTLLWTPYVPGSAVTVNIQSYIVQWSQEGKKQTEWKDSGQRQAEVSIGPGQCDFTVQAVIQSNSSVPAHITVLQRDDQKNPPAEKRLSCSTSAGFNLSWELHETAPCGYTVDWCIEGNAVLCALQWVKVSQGNNTLFLPARHFKAGCRYTFNIYGCRENMHQLLEVQTGYLQEHKSVPSPSLVKPVQSTSSSVTLEWRYNEDDAAHPAFITGYLVTVEEVGSDTLSGHAADLINVSVADPHRKSVTVEGLQQNHEYAFSVCALTKEGPGQAASITVRTKANYTAHMVKIVTPVLLLLGCTILLWPQRKTLQSGLKGIFVYPAGMNIKIPQLASFLQETGDRLQSEKPEECTSCNIEILNTRPFLTETTQGDPEDLNTSPSPAPALDLPLSCVPFQTDYCPQLWDGAALEQNTCITNQTYFHTMEEDLSETHVMLADIKSTLELSESQQESCNVICGYISNEVL
ncbi:leukemia inhibitory factor receptor isoform X2 [Notolabrus celidotus]|uniref:leukemia inhibitory factor receptor isoform X2 n=1 Tax=Notolabrus celidotus TaxID=1203425 RepID=UPI00148FCE9A|nr:leukemia inhibitory factor receptor isoform X2 [Notolabrus celidotus]